MSITGAALALQPQILAWAERDLRVVTPPSPDAHGSARTHLLERVRQQRPGHDGHRPDARARAHAAAAVTMTHADAPAPPGPRPQQTTIWVNPYTGAVVGQVDPTSAWRRFFRVITDWHRWLALAGESRTTGRWITGVSNAAFLVLGAQRDVSSGCRVCGPRAAVRAVLLFRAGLRARRATSTGTT